MYRMILYVSLISTCTLAEEFLKCSAVGKSNGKCFKDFYPDQEAQESNPLSPYEHYEPYEEHPVDYGVFGANSDYPSSSYSEHNHFSQGPEYDFGYSVHDEVTGDQKFHRESKHDNVVYGTYSLIEPDGSKRTVVYTADDVHGFKATVYRNDVGIVNNEFVHAPHFNADGNSNSHFPQAPRYDNIAEAHSQMDAPLTADLRAVHSLHHHELNNIPAAPIQPNFALNVHDQNSNLQQRQNVPIIVNPYRTEANFNSPPSVNSDASVSNQLNELLGQQNIVNALIENVEHPAPVPTIHRIEIPANIPEPNANYIKSTLSPMVVYTVHPSGHKLQSDFVENRNTATLDYTVGTSRGTSTPFSSTVSYPTPNPILGINSQNSTPLADNSESNSSSVVERPHHVGVTTPVPILNNSSSPSRLNAVTYGEFPLLAHVSPSYARRYARHYV